MSNSNFQYRVQQLSPQQRQFLAEWLGIYPVEGPGQVGHQRLVAYVTGKGKLDKTALRHFLQEKLPDYMVPPVLVVLDKIPRLPNGKIDYHHLPAKAGSEGFNKPEQDNILSPVEQKLVSIWEAVLKFSPIGIHDNFFEIGGDSILSIQIISKARKEGIALSPTQLFEHQTIAELALFAKEENTKAIYREALVGEVPLLPIQHWFFEEHRRAPHQWNQAFLLTLPEGMTAAILEQAVHHLVAHHDALRSRFVQQNGEWQAIIQAPANLAVFQKIDIKDMAGGASMQDMEKGAVSVQADFDLAAGNLFKALYFEQGEAAQGQLLLIAHHLLVDAVSWQILLEDLQSLCSQIQAGQPVALPAKSASIQQWGQYLSASAKSERLQKELAFWQNQIPAPPSFPTDFEGLLPAIEASADFVSTELDASNTQKWLAEAGQAYHTRPEEMLVAALVKTICDWTGSDSLCLGMERHGREVDDAGLDLTATVGWLTAYFPVTVAWAGSGGMGENLKTIKEQLRAIPNGGKGYGLLRYWVKEEVLKQQPFVIFNYLGQQGHPWGQPTAWTLGTRHPQAERWHFFEINTFVEQGKLQLRWSFSRDFYKKETVAKLAMDFKQNLLDIISHCLQVEGSGYTPSDFPEAGLGQADLDQLLGSLEL